MKICVYKIILFSIANKNFPGPGQYNLPSIFDRNRKDKLPLN